MFDYCSLIIAHCSYAGKEKEFSFWSTVGGLAGSFICTLGTAIISDRYDNIKISDNVVTQDVLDFWNRGIPNYHPDA